MGSHKVSFFFFVVVVGGVRCLPQRPTPPPPSQQPSQTNRLAAFSFPPSPPLGGSGWVAWGKGRGKRKEKKQLRRRRHRFLSFLSSRLFSNFVCIKQKVSFLSEIFNKEVSSLLSSKAIFMGGPDENRGAYFYVVNGKNVLLICERASVTHAPYYVHIFLVSEHNMFCRIPAPIRSDKNNVQEICSCHNVALCFVCVHGL